jgi:DNA-binding Lrp family transcriptional regulator
MLLTELQREFINSFQGNFPLQERPFQAIAERMRCSEDELIESTCRLKTENLLSRFGPLYDATSLGGGLTLAAIAVPEERYEIVTEMVNAYAEVAHNYRREHALNMWFVLATETPDEIASTLHAIEQTTKLKVYNFPKQHEFYIGLWLHLAADGRHTTVPVPVSDAAEIADCTMTDCSATDCSLDDIDRKLISVSQSGITIERTPYQTIADNLGTTQQDVLQRLNRMLRCGIIRRIGAVPNHYRLGLTANGMTVWDVDDDIVIELGNSIGQLDFVSHCYQRPRHLPVWRYNLFAMVHGHDRDEVNEKAQQIESILGRHCSAHETLFSSAILKKTGLRLAA